MPPNKKQKFFISWRLHWSRADGNHFPIWQQQKSGTLIRVIKKSGHLTCSVKSAQLASWFSLLGGPVCGLVRELVWQSNFISVHSSARDWTRNQDRGPTSRELDFQINLLLSTLLLVGLYPTDAGSPTSITRQLSTKKIRLFSMWIFVSTLTSKNSMTSVRWSVN